MSISTELARLAQNVGALTADTNAIFEALRAKGVDVPANAQLSDVADMIESIEVPSHENEVEIGGRWYPTVTIGNQIWMAENLDYQWSGLPVGTSDVSVSEPRAHYYENNKALYGLDGTYKCGLLYNYPATKYLNDNKSTLLPSGWHVPTNDEYDELVTYIGNNAGTKLKATNGTITSNFPSAYGGSNSYGWKGLPAGRFTGSSNNFGSVGYFWTATKTGSSAIYRILSNSETNFDFNTYDDRYEYGIRLVKDVT